MNKINPAFVIVTGDLVFAVESATISQAKEWYNTYSDSIKNFKLNLDKYLLWNKTLFRYF